MRHGADSSENAGRASNSAQRQPVVNAPHTRCPISPLGGTSNPIQNSMIILSCLGQASHSQAGPTGAMRPHHALSRVGRIRPAHGIWQPVCCRWIAPRARRECPSLRCIGQLLFPTHHALGVMPCLCPASHPRAVCAPTRHTHHPSPPCTLSLPCRPPSTGPSHDFMETDDGCHTPGAEEAAAGSEEVCMCPSALLPPTCGPHPP